MKLSRTYERTFFRWSVIEAALKELRASQVGLSPVVVPPEGEGQVSPVRLGPSFTSRSVQRGTDRWSLDNDDEFAHEYDQPDPPDSAYLMGETVLDYGLTLSQAAGLLRTTTVEVWAPTRQQVVQVLRVFDRAAPESALPKLEGPDLSKPVVFLGHGRSPQWRDLKDHLTDKQGVQVEAYEVGARAGHLVRDILGSMLARSSIAFLVLTAEDVAGSDADEMRARQNVVHELGLFQGKLGFERGIAVVEEGVEMFSNLDGVEQIRFPKDGIKATFGDVLATIRREFP